MLDKINRITKKKDFEAIFKAGKSVRGKYLTLSVLENGLNKSRFAFVASLKVSKKAVMRNKIRRRLSEIVRLNSDKIKPGYDFVFIAQPGIEKQGFDEIKSAVLKCLKQ